MSMADTNDTNNGTEAGNESDVTSGFAVPADNKDALEADPIIAKHLDIAIEAQDGKPSTKSSEQKEPTADKTKGGETPKADSASSTNDGTAQSKPKEEGQKTPEQTRGPKDLVLKGQGENGADLVIKGGAERRFYEQAQVARQRATAAEDRATRVEREAQQLRQQFEAVQNSIREVNGMPPTEVAGAVRLFTDLKRDPSGTLKKLLAEAVAMGHTVEGIGQGVDALAVQRMLDQRLAERDASNSGVASEEQIAADADAEVNQFYSRYPDARPHDALIAAALNDHPDLSLEAVYFQIKDGFAAKGFDWSRSLEDNLREQMAAASAPNAPNQEKPQNNGTQKPLPNGNGGEIAPEKKSNDVVMSENADTGDIVKAAMREAGLNI